MSFLSNLFNRKEQIKNLENPEETTDFLESEEEDFEDISNPTSEAEKIQKITPDEEDVNAVYEVVEREILPAKIICPDCGGITLEGLDFCDKCGGEL